MKPTIIYIDDEPRNLTVFEASITEDWKVVVFESAIEALKTIKEINPWVIVSDQKMPVMTGLEFLEVAAQILPQAVRIVVTGQTEEQTIIDLVKRAKIFDYITKPWDSDDLEARIKKGVEYYSAMEDRRRAFEELRKAHDELQKKNLELQNLMRELEETKEKERNLSREVESWAPAPIVSRIKEGKMTFPMRKDIVGVVYDIVDSYKLHDVSVNDVSVRKNVLRIFTETVLKYGGIRESCSGDSAYAHFGAFTEENCPYLSALAAAQGFRMALGNFSKVHKIPVECGIAVHVAPQALIHLHEFKVQTESGETIQKSIETESPQIDLLHRIEKLAHKLPGSNIFISKALIEKVPQMPESVIPIGEWSFRGQDKPTELFMIKSYFVTNEILDTFMADRASGSGCPILEFKKAS